VAARGSASTDRIIRRGSAGSGVPPPVTGNGAAYRTTTVLRYFEDEVFAMLRLQDSHRTDDWIRAT
jgi:hypothetical protein